MSTTRFTVAATSWTTPSIRRLHLQSEDLSAFAASEFTDRYVKLVFAAPGTELPEQVDVRAMRATMAPELLPIVRTYTALNPNVEAGTLDIDFVLHGDDGVAGPWAARAEVGDVLVANGPGGAYKPSADADWHLLVADESAIPALIAALEALPADAIARVIMLVDSEGQEPKLPLPANGTVTFVYRESASASNALEQAVRNLEWLDGRVHAFVHGEADETMRGVRPHLRTERGLSRDQLSISGYWRRGRSEDGFREWKAAFAESDAQSNPVAAQV